MYNAVPMQSTCATVAALMGIEAPVAAYAPCTQVVNYVEKRLGKPERVIMYNPDAIAHHMWQKYPELYTPVLELSPLPVPICTVMPSVTPVCFASMYTGVSPEVHGIRRYEKPVLACDTLFDCCIRAGKKCAIVSTANDSISMIFLERDMDYFIYPTLEEVNAKAHELIAEDKYDLLVIYNANFDSIMHRYGPESQEALGALDHNCREYAALAALAEKTGRKTALAFAPDHGCHEIDGGCGSHGLDMEEDLNVLHFWKCIG